MLYSLIPPILIILSLAGIAVFLMKKSSKIEKFISENKMAKREPADEPVGGGISGKIREQIKKVEAEKIKSFSLVILEKITSKSRIMFLKLESKCGNLISSIRSRRVENGKREVAPVKKVVLEKDKENFNRSEVFKKLGAYKIGKNENDNRFERKVVASIDAEEKVIKPIISEHVVSPSRGETKDRLEELLIERIAVNPKDVEAYERLGEYYLEIKSLEDSKECFKQVIKLDPANRNAKYRMRRLENLLAKR